MATVEPKSLYAVNVNEPQNAFFTVAIDTSGFADSADENGGRVSPCVASDFATGPTTIAESRKISRGHMRWKMMMQNLALRTNFRVVNIVTTYSSSAGDNPITALAFGLVYEDRNLIANTGTNVLEDSTAINTRALFIKDRIADALNTTHTENVLVFDPTTGVDTTRVEELEVQAVLSASVGEIAEAITVTEVTGFAPNTSNQLATDNALTYSSTDNA